MRRVAKRSKHKYVVKNLAHQVGMVPLLCRSQCLATTARGCTFISRCGAEGGTPSTPGDGYAELSQTARYYIGGLMEHARALFTICALTTNSYRRLVPGYEAPVYIAWSKRNRSAAIRVPVYERGVERTKRLEYRLPDPSCNPYLAFGVMLCAGLDGIKKKLECGDPVDENI